MRVIWADAGYGGNLISWVRAMRLGRCAQLDIVQKIKNNGFAILPRRWIIERTHAWLSRYRRLARDYEVKTDHSEAFPYIAACAIMTRRLRKSSLF